MNAPTDWLSAFGILLSGLVLGFMFVYAQSRKKSSATKETTPDLELLELEAKRDAHIRQLRELDDQGVTTGEERRRLELETAGLLRAIDGHKLQAKRPQKGKDPAATVAVAVAPGDSFFARHPAVKGFLWGVGSIAALAFLGYYVFRSSSDRQAGSGATGGAPMQQVQQTTTDPHAATPSSDPAVLQMEQAVKADPGNVDARIALARAYLDRENMMGVFEQTRAVLEKNPSEPRAQTYNAIVRMAMGKADEAQTMLEAATKTDPRLVDAWVALAWIHSQKGEKDRAEAAIQQGIRNSPEHADKLKEVWAEMSSQPAAAAMAPGGNPPATGGPMASLPPDHPGMPPASDPGSPAQAKVDPASAIHLTILLDAGAKAKSGIVYIIARDEGQTAGMPLAVKRLSASVFPLALDLSSADSMMGQPLPKKVSIEARLDTDGDAATKGPNDPKAFAASVATGVKLAMTLK